MSALAQEKSITGKVLNSTDGSPMQDVSVSVNALGKKIQTLTNSEGSYTIKTPVNATEITFTHVGMKPVKEPINGRTTITVSLVNLNVDLQDVVVIGYQTIKKSDLTGSVTTVSKKEATDRIVTSLSDLMKGRAAGVQITENDGTPGGGSTIYIRGASSINGSNTPLYVIDGIIGSGDDVNPADIESIEILKDASSTAIYGSQGANGVIMITTKKGSVGKTKLDFYTNYGFQNIPKYIPMMNSAEYERAIFGKNSITYYKKGTPYTIASNQTGYYDAEGDVYVYPSTGADDWKNYYSPDSINTDWQRQIYQQSLAKDYRLNVSGGNEKQTYSLMLDYFGQNGIVVNSGINKFSGRFNLKQELRQNVTLNLNISAINQNRKGIISGTDNSIVWQALTQPPIKPVNSTEKDDISGETPGVNNNPYYQAMHQTLNYFNTSLSSSIVLNWKINKAFNFQTQNSYLPTNGTNEIFYPSNTAQGASSNGLGRLVTQRGYGLVTENVLYYNPYIGSKHKIASLIGTSYDYRQNNTITTENRNYQVETLGINGIGLGTVPQIPTKYLTEATLVSIFGRINYTYNNKYLLTASVRRDGSSRFGAGNKYAYFPSGAFAWRADQEKFIKNLNIFSNLKFRSSWGMSGNQAIPSYQSLSLLTNALTPINGSTPTFGVAPNQVANPMLRWETSTQTDLGIDIGLFNSRVNLTLDWYKKTTKDLLNQLSTPVYTGYNTYWTNYGTIENKGLEIALDAKLIQSRNFKWTTQYNMSFNRGKVIEISQNGYLLRNPGFFSSGNFNIVQEGSQLGLWYGFIQTGIYQSQSEIDNSGIKQIFAFPVSTIQPGWKKIQDQNGDGIIDDKDKVVLGSGAPDFTGGFVNRFSYKNIDLSVAFQFSYGADIFNATKVKSIVQRGYYNLSTEVNDRWAPDLYAINSNGTKGALVIPGNPSNLYPRDGFFEDNYLYNTNIEDGSFIRLSDVSLSYSFTRNITRKVRVSGIRLFASAKNLLLFTKYSGYDPEVNTSNNTLFAPGMDYGAYPKARTFAFGANITF